MTSGAAAATFDGDVDAAFHRAAAESGLQRVYCRLAETTIGFELAGQVVAPLTRALAHRACGTAATDLTIRVFTHTALPSPPWDWARLESRGVVVADDPAWCISYQDDVLSLWRQGAPTALVWLRDATQLTLAQRGSPFLHLLHAWANSRGWAVLHASAAAGVLLVGPGGAGKSSSALACARAGLPYLADDYCLARGGRLESLYCSAKVLEHDLTGPAEYHEPGGKALFWMEPVSHADLRAVVIPEQTGEPRASLEPVSPARALRALAPSTLYQLPWSGPHTMRLLSEIVRRVPCYRLRLGARHDVPRLLETLA